MAVITQGPLSSSSLLHIVGAFTAVFGLAVGLLVLFVIPDACSFVGSLQVLILGALLVAGGFAFLLGHVLERREKR